MHIPSRTNACSSICLPDSYYIIRLYQSGKSCSQIGKELDYDLQAVNMLLKKMGLMRNTKPYQKLIDHSWLDSIDTEVKAYFAGIIAADGWINKNTVFLALKQSDRCILDQLVETAFPFIPVRTYNSSHPGAEDQCRIHITSSQWIKSLNELGISTAKSLTIGDVTSLIPEDVRHHFVRGYFDGDGSVYHSVYRNKKKVAISFRGTQKFLEGIQAAIDLPVGKIYSTKGSDIKSLVICGKGRMFQVAEYLYKDSTIFLPRKRERFTW